MILKHKCRRGSFGKFHDISTGVCASQSYQYNSRKDIAILASGGKMSSESHASFKRRLHLWWSCEFEIDNMAFLWREGENCVHRLRYKEKIEEERLGVNSEILGYIFRYASANFFPLPDVQEFLLLWMLL